MEIVDCNNELFVYVYLQACILCLSFNTFVLELSSYLKSVGHKSVCHIITDLSFSQSAQRKYQPLGPGSTDLHCLTLREATIHDAISIFLECLCGGPPCVHGILGNVCFCRGTELLR